VRAGRRHVSARDATRRDAHARGALAGDAATDASECVEGGVVGVGEGVEVFLGGAEAAVAEAFFDGLDVGAAGEEPGGVGVA
jgi:hypothetical protein